MENIAKALVKVFLLDFIIFQETAGLKVGVSSRINEWLTKTPESNKSPAPKPSVSKLTRTISSAGGFSSAAEVVMVLPQAADGLWRNFAACPLLEAHRGPKAADSWIVRKVGDKQGSSHLKA